MQHKLKQLLALQEADRAIMAIRGELHALEPELAELDGSVQRVEDALAAVQGALESASTRRQDLDTRMETYKVMQERRRQKLEWVRGAKEASALMAEIDLARGVLAKEETDWIRSADEVQEVEARVAEGEEKVAAAVESQVERRGEIAKVQEECHGRLAEAAKVREAAAKEVDRTLLQVYTRILKGRAPFAMYELHGDACGHCFTSVPMHLRQQMERGETLPTCEACGVLIFLGE